MALSRDVGRFNAIGHLYLGFAPEVESRGGAVV
jgi:hypothetical protein